VKVIVAQENDFQNLNCKKLTKMKKSLKSTNVVSRLSPHSSSGEMTSRFTPKDSTNAGLSANAGLATAIMFPPDVDSTWMAAPRGSKNLAAAVVKAVDGMFSSRDISLNSASTKSRSSPLLV
jgi:hypothetical protein